MNSTGHKFTDDAFIRQKLHGKRKQDQNIKLVSNLELQLQSFKQYFASISLKLIFHSQEMALHCEDPNINHNLAQLSVEQFDVKNLCEIIDFMVQDRKEMGQKVGEFERILGELKEERDELWLMIQEFQPSNQPHFEFERKEKRTASQTNMFSHLEKEREVSVSELVGTPCFFLLDYIPEWLLIDLRCL